MNEPDFFKQHENVESHKIETIIPTEEKAFLAPNATSTDDNIEKNTPEVASSSLGPSVKLSDSISSTQAERKPTIGRRTAQTKRPGVSLQTRDKTVTTIIYHVLRNRFLVLQLGKKPGSLGAQRVNTNFDELEKSIVEASKLAEEKDQPVTKEEQEELSTRLAYRYEQNLSQQAKKMKERAKQLDPLKAGQADRLGMGFNTRR